MGQVADRYITPGGRTDAYDKAAMTGDIIDAASFLVWAEHDREMFGGVRAGDAYRAFCRLLDLDGVALRNIVMGREPRATRQDKDGSK